MSEKQYYFPIFSKPWPSTPDRLFGTVTNADLVKKVDALAELLYTIQSQNIHLHQQMLALADYQQLLSQSDCKSSGPPGPLFIFIQSENEMGLQFKIKLPKPGDGDVVKGILNVAIGDRPFPMINTTPDMEEVLGIPGEDGKIVPFEGDEGEEVRLEYHFVDNAGNHGAKTSSTFTLIDDIAPSAPGKLGIVNVTEVFPEDEEPNGDLDPNEDPAAGTEDQETGTEDQDADSGEPADGDDTDAGQSTDESESTAEGEIGESGPVGDVGQPADAEPAVEDETGEVAEGEAGEGEETEEKPE